MTRKSGPPAYGIYFLPVALLMISMVPKCIVPSYITVASTYDLVYLTIYN